MQYQVGTQGMQGAGGLCAQAVHPTGNQYNLSG